MTNIAIVEDDVKTQELLKSYLADFTAKSGEEFRVHCFENPVNFLTDYRANYDIVLMDIELPHMNGMEVSHKLREMDKSVTLIFVTNMAQFAVEGYAVDAFDYIVKPVSCDDFALKLDRALKRIRRASDVKLKIAVNYSIKLILSSQLKYVEVIGHKLIYHTVSDGNLTTTGTLKEVEEKLAGKGFAKCNNCYLVNLRFVTGIEKQTVTVGDEELQISYPKRKDFMRALNDHLGSGSGGGGGRLK